MICAWMCKLEDELVFFSLLLIGLSSASLKAVTVICCDRCLGHCWLVGGLFFKAPSPCASWGDVAVGKLMSGLLTFSCYLLFLVVLVWLASAAGG